MTNLLDNIDNQLKLAKLAGYPQPRIVLDVIRIGTQGDVFDYLAPETTLRLMERLKIGVLPVGNKGYSATAEWNRTALIGKYWEADTIHEAVALCALEIGE